MNSEKWIETDIKPNLNVSRGLDTVGLGGLVAIVNEVENPLPLRDVKVRAHVVGDCCRTEIEQHFRNDLDKVLEAIHIFPLPEGGAVVEMELRAGEVTVKAECRERSEAESLYQSAREEGLRAGLLTQERSDVHTLRVTNLPPKTDVYVRMILLEKLETVDSRLRWRFPTVIAPRYLPGDPVGHEGPGTLPDSNHVPDASNLQPPLRLKGGTTLDLEVVIEGRVSELESSLHAICIDLGEDSDEGIRVVPSGKTSLDRDFVLAFTTADADRVAGRAYTDGHYTLLFVEPPSIEIPEALPRDATFIIDRSGSMNGPKMAAAKLALKSALHGLQQQDRFNLIAFSNEMQVFSESLVDYSQASLDQAKAWIDEMFAQGGTEMLPAVTQALAIEEVEGRVATVLLITDGQVWNESELIAAVGHRRGAVSFFTMGIGTAVSSSLLKRMARVGGGTCELLAPSDDIEAAVVRFEARFGAPIAEVSEIDGGQLADHRVRTLFSGRPESWLIESAPDVVSVKGKTLNGDMNLTIEPVKIDFPLGGIWACEKVAALEDRITLHPNEEEGLRPEILRIALEHGIASRFTAFVAIESSLKVSGERVEIVQPVELPHEWDESFLGVPGTDQLRGVPLGKAMAKGKIASISNAFPQAMMAPQFAPRKRRDLASEELPSGSVKAQSIMHDGHLARLQGADGSYGGDTQRTAAALIALVLLGHTRRKGIRRRTVIKAAKWLDTVQADSTTALALRILDGVERGQIPEILLRDFRSEIQDLTKTAGQEGKILREVIKDVESA